MRLYIFDGSMHNKTATLT